MAKKIPINKKNLTLLYNKKKLDKYHELLDEVVFSEVSDSDGKLSIPLEHLQNTTVNSKLDLLFDLKNSCRDGLGFELNFKVIVSIKKPRFETFDELLYKLENLVSHS